MNLLICARNAIDNAVITASPALDVAQPGKHLKLSSRSRVARTVGTAAQEYKFTWNGQGYYANFFSWYRHNLEPGATWRVIAYPNADWTGTPVYDSTTVAPYPAYLLGDYGAEFGVLELGYTLATFLPQPRISTLTFTRGLALSFKVTVTNVGNADGFLDVSRAYVGDGVEMIVPPGSASVVWRDDGKLTAASGGGPRVDVSGQYRVLSVDVPWIDSSQRSKILDMQRFAGSNRDLFVSVFPGAGAELQRDHELIGKLIEVADVQTAAAFDATGQMWATRFKFREI